MLTGFSGTVVLHCFSSPELLPVALERRYYVSFAGNVTYPKADDLREAARRVPSDRLLAETDTPYLAPQPVRGRANEPANVVHTIAALASARGEDTDDLGRRLAANAATAFRLPT
jgi:TatD DNase family protein